MSALSTGRRMLAAGYWVVAIYPEQKRPIGTEWGLKKWSQDELQARFEQHPEAGIGVCLGPGRAPAGGWLIDLEGDGPEAEESLLRLLGGELPVTVGWASTRGKHTLFAADGERLLKLLIGAGAKEGSGLGAGVWHLDQLPGLEFRVGGFKEDGQTVKQVQSVCPPTPGTDGRQREWIVYPREEVVELPKTSYQVLEGLATTRSEADESKHETADSAENKTVARGQRESDSISIEGRVLAYLAKCEPAISGSGGHNKAFAVACKVGPGFNLSSAETLRLLKADWNQRCSPPWSDHELEHKIADAFQVETRRGWLLHAGENGDVPKRGRGRPRGSGDVAVEPTFAQPKTDVNEAADDPHRLARLFSWKHDHEGTEVLRFYRGEWFRWDEGAYRGIAEHELRGSVTQTEKDEFDRINLLAIKLWEEAGRVGPKGEPIEKPIVRKVTRQLTSNVISALESMRILPDKTDPPFWIEGDISINPQELLPTHNALIHIPSVTFGDLVDSSKFVFPPTPRLFSTYALNFDFDTDAGAPLQFIKFLASIWPEDGDSILSLQEWFGYCLTPDTRQQKIGMFIGPMRSGRGTIARLIRALVGAENVAGPRLSAFASNFGMEPLIGKPLAIIGDARISGRQDTSAVVEAMLSISGEDTLTIDRKHKASWTGKLPTRLMILSNELPKLPDQSGALASRFLVWKFTKSFLGEEDLELDRRLAVELPGILLWAIEGWKRLRDRGHFAQPASGQALADQIRDIGSPVGAYVRERCVMGPGCEIRIVDLFSDWCSWCETQKRKFNDEAIFGRNLRAVVPTIETKQKRGDRKLGEKSHVRWFIGIRLKTEEESGADGAPF
jgi:putative DNA primase/helicase